MFISFDLKPIKEYLDTNMTFAREMSKPRTMSAASEAMLRMSTAASGAYIDTKADRNPDLLHHVYEWGKVGEREARLWDTIMRGRGNSKVLYYQFKKSNSIVPAGEDMTGFAGDTRKPIHIFHWKAAIMEEGSSVRVAPKSPYRPLAWPTSGGMAFTRGGSWTIVPGQHTRGQFQKAWMEFWEAMVEPYLYEEFIEPAEDAIGEMLHDLYRAIKPSAPTKKGPGIHIGGRSYMEPKTIEAVNRLRQKWYRQALQREAMAGEAGSVLT